MIRHESEEFPCEEIIPTFLRLWTFDYRWARAKPPRRKVFQKQKNHPLSSFASLRLCARRSSYLGDVRIVVDHLREYGNWRAWRAAQDLQRCL